MHGGKFPWSLRLGATSFAWSRGKKLSQSCEKSANFADLDRGGATDSAQLYRKKFLQSYGKSARFSGDKKGGEIKFAQSDDKTLHGKPLNFARNRDKIVRRDLENSEQNRKIFANSGFTIIEVALVLAIAGLIFLVVFLALPALQRSQRDTARRQDVAKAVAAIQQYFAGGGDASQATFTPYAGRMGKSYHQLGESGSPVDSYLTSAGFSSNVVYENIRIGDGAAFPGSNAVELWPTHKCGAKNPDGSLAMTPATSYDMAVVVRLEAGTSGEGLTSAAGAVFYCADAGR